MVMAPFDDPWSVVDDACLAAELADFDLLEQERSTTTPLPLVVHDQCAESVAEVLGLVVRLGPCADAAVLLESLSDRELTQDEWLSVVQAWRPIQWWSAGQGVAATAAFAGSEPELRSPSDIDVTVPELAAALDVDADEARAQIASARVLHGLLSATGAALARGRIEPVRAAVLLHSLGDLPPEKAQLAEAALLPHAMRGSLRNLRDRIRRRVDRLDPDAALRRFAHAHKRRRVETDLEGDAGLVALHAYLPPVEGLAVSRRLDQLAGSFDPDDGRSKDERVADALIGCVLGFDAAQPCHPAKVPVTVNVTVDLPTLLGLQSNPAELGGYGPIPPELARAWAADAAWRRFVFEPVDGHLIDRGHSLYRPDAELESYLRARDLNCRFPGSTRSANLDLDHNEAYHHAAPEGGGTTSAGNMAGLFRYYHRVKTHGGFTLANDGRGGLTWTTFLGRVYRTRPHNYRPDADTDPP